MEILDIFLHLGDYLGRIIEVFGIWTYVILFLVIFAETGLVVTPFLPGDSLLFVVGTFAGSGYLSIFVVYFTILTAAILGDSVNYWFGNKLGPKVFYKEKSRVFNKKYLEMTREFYEKHGGKTIIIARFVPIVRTFAPFVAGIGSMKYKTFLFYNVTGALLWVTSLTMAGFFFGNLPIIKENFEYAIYLIIFISLIPMFLEFAKHKFGKEKNQKHAETTSYKEIKETFKEEKLT